LPARPGRGRRRCGASVRRRPLAGGGSGYTGQSPGGRPPVNLEPGTQLADWARRKKGLVALAVILVCWITGWVWVVVLDRPAGVIDGSRVGHFPALIVLGGFLLFPGVWGAYLAAHALAAVTVLVVGGLKTPVRLGRWVATNGVPGMAGPGGWVGGFALGRGPLLLFRQVAG